MTSSAAIVFFQEIPEVLLKRAYIGGPGRRSGIAQVTSAQIGIGDRIRAFTGNQ
jgi:hypothetical protein